MARRVEKPLTALQVRKEKRPGVYCDGGALYLQVTGKDGSAKSWVFKYSDRDLTGGKVREMGLGPASTYTLAEARELARLARQQVKELIDPIEARRAQRAALAVQRIKLLTFKQRVDAYVAKNRDGWRSRDYASAWTTRKSHLPRAEKSAGRED